MRWPAPSVHWLYFTVAGLAIVWCIAALMHRHQYLQLEASIAAFDQTPLAPDAQIDWPALPAPRSASGCLGTAMNLQVRLYVRAATRALYLGDEHKHDTYLAAAEQSLKRYLACRPFHAKAWLNLALIRQEREGFTPATEEALIHSARLSPAEAWIAELRLPIAAAFMPFAQSDDFSRMVHEDFSSMQSALMWRRARLKKRIGIDSLHPLELGIEEFCGFRECELSPAQP